MNAERIGAGGRRAGDLAMRALLIAIAVLGYAAALQSLFVTLPADVARAQRDGLPLNILVALFMQALALAIPTACLLFFRRRLALARSREVSRPEPGSVIYLRAFEDDERAAGTRWMPRLLPLPSQEEQLASVLADIGPVVAIGRPREPLPYLGALRLQLGDDTWQRDLLGFMGEARLVVMRLPVMPSEGVRWELQQLLEGPHRAKALLMVPASLRAVAHLRLLLGDRLVAAPPALGLARRLWGPATLGFCKPLADGRWQFDPIQRPGFFKRSWLQRETPLLRQTLATALAGRAFTVRPPRPRWLRVGFVSLTALWLLLGVVVWI